MAAFQRETDLIDKFRSRHPELGKLVVRMDGDELVVHAPGSEDRLLLTQDPYQWTFNSVDGHAHFDSFPEASDLVVKLVLGQARTVREFRGEVLAATWIEYEVEDGVFEADHKAVSLNPFDADDWQLWPGEHWRQERRARTFDPVTGEVTINLRERFPADDQIHPPESTKWLDDGLGAPIVGMRWSPGHDGGFVLQKPVGWRLIRKDEWVEFAPYEGKPIMRVRNVYRPIKSGRPQSVPKAVRPVSVKFEEGGSGAGWQIHRWTVIFNDGEYEMMGLIELLYLPESEDTAHGLIPVFQAALPLSLYVPKDWDCSYSEE